MVVATVGTVAVVATGGTAAIAGAGLGATYGAGAATVGTTQALGVATGVGLSSGAIAGASVAASGGASVAAGAAAGAAAGGTAAAGVGATGAGLGAFVVSTGGLGLIAIGTRRDKNEITYDCWKPVLHDTSPEPSTGMLLKDMLRHPNVNGVSVSGSDIPELPNIVVENVWNERFLIEYLIIKETGNFVGHAKRLFN